MNRRTVVRTIGGASGGVLAGTAGCLTRDDEDEPDEEDDDPEPDEPEYDETLRIVTYRSMVTGTDPAGPWLAETFEEAYPDADLEWIVPNAGIEHYVRRGVHDAEIDADVCLGFTVGDLARIDDRVGEGGLFRELNHERIGGIERVREELAFGDPHGRAVAYDAGYVCLVYDERVVDEPGTFADLITDEYADALLVQHPVFSMPGQAFLLWTIEAGGPDDALAYWNDLTANGVRITDSWRSAYDDYTNEERPMVVSYSTDPAFATAQNHDLARHRVAFPNDEGYALPEGMGVFEDATAVDLAYAFLEFVLSQETQIELAERNVQFPAVDDVDLPMAFDGPAREPPEPVATDYTDLRGSVGEWLADWTERVDVVT